MAEIKRAWKQREFTAHASNVNCVSLGCKSGKFLATGGEDRKVNIWSVGKPNCLMTLQGHTTAVECVRFGQDEKMVVAGSISGAMKVWDLEQAKIMRTLTGHKAAINSLDFHPFGDYTASASLDCNIKLWDIKRKGCIYTYKGHTNGVNCLRFSPDGRWIASAGCDGIIKIWDLNAGKLLTDLQGHLGPVNIVEFHPNEMLLASGSFDKTVKLWDLETFSAVDTTSENSGPVKCIAFHPDGICLYCGSGSQARVYTWEPSQLIDTVFVGWPEAQDLSFFRDQLIGASFTQTNVSVFVIDSTKVAPLGSAEIGDNVASGENISHQTKPLGFKNSMKERPITRCIKRNSEPCSTSIEPPTVPSPEDPQEPSANIRNVDDYTAAFKTRNKISRSPRSSPPPRNVPDISSQSTNIPSSEPKHQTKAPIKVERFSVDPPEPIPERPTLNKNVSKRLPPPTGQARPDPKQSNGQYQEAVSKQPLNRHIKVESSLPPRSDPKGATPVAQVAPVVIVKESKNQQQPSITDDFLQKHERRKAICEDDLFIQLNNGHNAVIPVVQSRGRNLQMLRTIWSTGNIKTVIDSAIGMQDQSVLVDLLQVFNNRPKLWTLDICSLLLSQLIDLFGSKYNNYVQTSCFSIKLLLKNLGPVIKANILSTPSIGVDISREERQRKCSVMYTQLQKLHKIIEKKGQTSTVLKQEFCEIGLLLNTLD